MCNETTEAENEAFLDREREVSRRNLAVGAAAAAVLAGCGGTVHKGIEKPKMPVPPDEPALEAAAETKHEAVTITTPDGEADAVFIAPAEGQHPGIIVWPDVAGLREAYETMGARLAAEGYAVLIVNPYYRSEKAPILKTFAEWRTDEGRAKIKPMREALTHETVTADAGAYVAWLDARPEVDTKRDLATTGYCMGGPFTFRTAAASKRVGAIGSFHGGGLVTEEPTSPHELMSGMDAAVLICIAQNDDARSPDDKVRLREAAEAASLPAEVEVYPAQHGWCTIDSPVYDEAQAEKAWRRMLAWLGQHL